MGFAFGQRRVKSPTKIASVTTRMMSGWWRMVNTCDNRNIATAWKKNEEEDPWNDKATNANRSYFVDECQAKDGLM